jgi:modulator of FtsH protease
VAGIILLTGSYLGLYWMAAGVLLVFAGSVANAWVLLIEILR